MAENYRALTRTYRPRTFDEIVSQQHVSDTLKNAIKQNRLAHAYMFCGPRGVGKTTMARVLARAANDIDSEVDGESLNQTLNVVEIDAASNNSVDDIRDLRERVRVPPQNGRFKIYIIDEVHMLSKQAFNALLKTLEEPPPHIIFIFATTEPHKVLPTILSRVQRFDFKRISVDEIVAHLGQVADNEGIGIDSESLHVIAKKADGALRDALGLLDQAIAFCGTDINHEELLRALNVVSTDRIFRFMEAVENRDASSGLEQVNELLQDGYDIQEFLIGLTEHLRNLYVAGSSEKMYLVEASAETKKRYRDASKSFSQEDLMRMLHLVSEAQYKIKEAHQPKIQFEITLLKLIHMERTRNLNALLEELQDLKKKLSNPDGIQANEGKEQESGNPERGTENNEQKLESGDQETGDNRQVQENTGQDGGSQQNGVKQPGPEDVDEIEDEDQTGFFEKPSLGNGDARNSGNGTQESQDPSGTEPRVATAAKPKHVDLEAVQGQWEEYVALLREKVPQMLYFQMQRLEPVELKNRVLTLRCNDEFAKKIVEENKRELGKILERLTGVFLRFECLVQKSAEENDEESLSPYERFKRLQKNDPTIKKLVELFGAELDYNLNR